MTTSFICTTFSYLPVFLAVSARSGHFSQYEGLETEFMMKTQDYWVPRSLTTTQGKTGEVVVQDSFGTPNDDSSIYVAHNKSILQLTDLELYTTARLSPLSLTYYGRCLANGNYTVTLHFAEIIFRDNQSFQSLGRRMFDVYIQGERRLEDFDIEREAKEVDKAVIRQFKIVMKNTTLEIRFHYTGKGTTDVPAPGSYGSIIYAILVESDFKPSPIGADVLAALLMIILGLVYCFLWRNKRAQTSMMSREKGFFTYAQIQVATNNFSSENKLGQGGSASV